LVAAEAPGGAATPSVATAMMERRMRVRPVLAIVRRAPGVRQHG
jgi:hypothetical protein